MSELANVLNKPTTVTTYFAEERKSLVVKKKKKKQYKWIAVKNYDCKTTVNFTNKVSVTVLASIQ